ncbi:DNA-3-methyladenine glycosylase [Enterococcus asini]|uniref:DNA-3-methyladenine glycosylase n=1 Tax=Enterococcus asini TaxID=57732 RepID=UPI00288FFE08|nr:DNA-3-methyladenine glycosylase [Enterococcus asini]MDT2757253.1 DNA-3-methyladenine glycosylase [Enterococcus asini]
MTESMTEIRQLFQNEDTPTVAQALVGMYLEHTLPDGSKLGGWIVDCEAYLGPEDEAAHSFGLRKTPRVAAMYQEAGSIYLYHMHRQGILNMVTREAGLPQGVMIRALEPERQYMEKMSENRGGKSGVDLTNGPGKLMSALNVPFDLYGQSIFTSALHLVPEKKRQPKQILALPRIGIPNKGKWTALPLRFVCKGNPYVTKQLKKEISPDWGWQE